MMWKWITGGVLAVLVLGIGFKVLSGGGGDSPAPEPAVTDSTPPSPPSDAAPQPADPATAWLTCKDLSVRWDDQDSGCIVAATVLGSAWSHKTISDIQKDLDGLSRKGFKAYDARVIKAARNFAFDNHSARLTNKAQIFGNKTKKIDEMSPAELGEFLHQNAELIDAGRGRGTSGGKGKASKPSHPGLTSTRAPDPLVECPPPALPSAGAPTSGTFQVP